MIVLIRYLILNELAVVQYVQYLDHGRSEQNQLSSILTRD